MYYRLQDPAHLDTLTQPGQTSTEYGTGNERQGKSVLDSIEALATYLAGSGVQFTADWVLVELDGHRSDDKDHDAHLGVELIHPTRILSVRTFRDFEPHLDAACDALGIG